MNDKLKRILAAKHPTKHRQTRRNETLSCELRKRILVLNEKQIKFNRGERLRQRNVHVESNTGIRIDNNNIVSSALIRCLGDSSYDYSPHYENEE